ncbi:MAG: hypothetical protein ABIR79_00670 [Candidatus Binatia bacterium]
MRRFLEACGRLLAPAPASGVFDCLRSLALFVSGAALANLFLMSSSMVVFSALVVVLSALAALCIVPHRMTTLRVVARSLLTVTHLGWIAQAVALAIMLSWSVPTWVWVVDGVLGAFAVVTAFTLRFGFRLPMALPIGLAIAALLTGWDREDGAIRCDDYLRVLASPVSIVVPTTPALGTCQAGQHLNLDRYPRRFWEYPEGGRYLVTTQRGRRLSTTDESSVWFAGAVCEVREGSDQRPSCFGEGKGHGIVESEARDRLYVASFGASEGWVYAVPRHGPFRPLAEAHLPAGTATLYVDDASNTIGLFADDGIHLSRLRASDLSPLDPVPGPFAADEVHYDQKLREGIICFGVGPVRTLDGEAFVAAAFKGAPFVARPLAPSSRYPSSWFAMIWGCDWDPVERRAYVAIANLGLLEVVQYDTGDVLDRTFVAFGMRTLAFDRARRRVYAGVFLSGEVLAIDADTGVVTDHWFAGRFIRYVALGRDGATLLVASNLGIVRIPLTPP